MVAIGSLRYMAIQISHAAVLVIKLLVIIRATVSLQWPFLLRVLGLLHFMNNEKVT